MRFLTHDSKISCIDDNGKEVGKITFPKRENNVYEITSTKVEESMQGRGIAGKLMRLCLNEINLRGGEVKAICSYAQKYIEKVTGDFLFGKTGTRVSETYYELNRKLKGDAFACGRVTMESSFTGGFKPDLSEFSDADIPYEDYTLLRSMAIMRFPLTDTALLAGQTAGFMILTQVMMTAISLRC